MKQTRKVLASALALSVIIGAGTMTSLAAGAEDGALPGGQPKCAGGRDIYLNAVVVEDGAFLFMGVRETGKGTVAVMAGDPGERNAGNRSVRAYPERETDISYSYDIYDRDGILLARLVSTVEGVYSQADGYALVSSVTGGFSGADADRFSCTSSCNGNTGTIAVWCDGSDLVSFSYRLNTNGSVREI